MDKIHWGFSLNKRLPIAPEKWGKQDKYGKELQPSYKH